VHHAFESISVKREQILDRGLVACGGTFQELRYDVGIGRHYNGLYYWKCARTTFVSIVTRISSKNSSYR
jgi:hypothetical protein